MIVRLLIASLLLASCGIETTNKVEGETIVRHVIEFDLSSIKDFYEDICDNGLRSEDQIKQCAIEGAESFLKLLEELSSEDQ